jgi:hypothetical protein
MVSHFGMVEGICHFMNSVGKMIIDSCCQIRQDVISDVILISGPLHSKPSIPIAVGVYLVTLISMSSLENIYQ